MNANENTYYDPLKEEVIYQNPLLFLKIWDIASDANYCDTVETHPWHYHKEVEFLAMIEGHLGIQTKLDYTILGPGDVMILGTSQPHRSHKPYKENLKYIVFQVDLVRHFDESTIPYQYAFSELTQPLDELNYIFKSNQTTRAEINHLIEEMFKESQIQQKGYEIAISYSIKKLLLLLLRNDTQNVLNYTDETDLTRLRPVLDYVDVHLADKIYVEDACALINLSYHYFIRYFKKHMGVSFLDYVNYKRIKKSELLLLTSELSIVEVSYEVGISNMAQFYKLFKRHNHCSPKEFKQRMREK